jgi:phosphatidylethanolamine/phosphatidyl-N-methylethanolamine N-methyltransferase
MKRNPRSAAVATERKLPVSDEGYDHSREAQLRQKVEQLRMGIVDRIVFLQEFLKHPRQVASIVPSSRFLERRIVELADIRSARTVVELGTGTGGTTRAILEAMAPDAKLLSIEINPQLCALLGRIRDRRLFVHCGNAYELRNALSSYGLAAPEAVVSGIPFSTMQRDTAQRVLETISAALVPGGRFLAYQVSSQVDDLSSPLLGPARVEVEFRNIPPVRLYRWEKRSPAVNSA